MSFVFDADIISIFAKVKRLDLLTKVFGNDLLLPKAVYDDLAQAKNAGYDYLTPASQLFQLISLQKEEIELVNTLSLNRTICLGELHCIAICKKREYIFVTNDTKAKSEAAIQNVTFVDLGGILWHIKLENIISIKELGELINDIEEKDNTTLLGKEELLED